ncbi:aminotransferase class I/II-fold pyridoxal phosphate-dependent enzyme [Nosocomiicoccus massiliensis]|uniref:Orn/Lys/Arg family decarboxylase n=1 Tax=Nosocomiicoccus massiliensis TaxID=1232430 RepID=UPI0003F950E9|nr:aminotransferase class I/II-fold pyridoxal phosphate-dependent enzyme [Nosocomiicoccus massiliensis]
MKLQDALKQVSTGISMHVPGHKNNTIGFLSDIKIDYDLTEVPGLDNLHEPEDVLKELNDTLGTPYNRYAQLVVNGSTTGMLASVHALNNKSNDFFYIGDAHKSLYNGLSLLDKTPLEFRLSHMKKGDVVVITSPTYYGDVLDVKDTITDVKQRGGYVIVDEAHGAHLSMTENFPSSLIESDADVVIQSYHKMLPSLTGASVTFVKDKSIHDRMMHYINIFETSSPNYLVMASIESAQRFYNTFDDHIFFKKREQLIHHLKQFDISVETVDDPAKIVLNKEGQSPYDLERSLRDVNIYSEMVSERGVLWCLPLWHDNDRYPFEQLVEAIRNLTVKELDETTIDISELHGKRAVETITPYPPGVPLILAGEVIDINRLDEFVKKNVKIEGLRKNLEYYNIEV